MDERHLTTCPVTTPSELTRTRRQKVWIHLQGCDVTVWNYYHPLGDYVSALLSNGFELLNFVEPHDIAPA